MKSQSLIQNTDRTQQKQSSLKPIATDQYVDKESKTITWLKIKCLLIGTKLLIFCIFALSIVIEKNNQTVNSFEIGGAIMLGLFLIYVVCFGFAWYKGSAKRDQMKKQAVERTFLLQKQCFQVQQ